MKNLMLIILTLFLLSCNTSKKSKENINSEISEEKQDTKNNAEKEENIDPNIFAIIKRTPCFGSCKVYKATIYKDGRAIYEGQMFVDRIGKYQTKVDENFIKNFIDKAESFGYFKMENEYDNKGITDLPATYTTIQINGKAKNILARYNYPKELNLFHKYFEEEIEKLNWEKIE